MPKNSQSNIWKYTLVLIANKRIFVAILGAYYLTIPGVAAQQVGIILLAGSLTGFMFEIPSGYLSDKIGHKRVIVLSRIFMLVSTMFFLSAHTLGFLILGSIFLSMSAAFHSGAGSAFMHDTLRVLNRESDYAKIMGKSSSIGFAVPIIFMVITPFLVSVNYTTPFIIALVIDVIGLCAALSLVSPPLTREHAHEIKVTSFRQVIQEGYRLKFFRFALLSGIIGGTLFGISGFRAPYQSFLEIPVVWFGVFFGIGRALASLMLAYSGRIRAMTTMRSFYAFEIVLYTALFIALGIVSNPWIVVTVFIFINAFHWGLSRIEEGYLLEVIKTSSFKATLLSTGSLIDHAVSAIAGFGLGFLIHRFSYQGGYLYIGIMFLILMIPLYASIFKYQPKNL